MITRNDIRDILDSLRIATRLGPQGEIVLNFEPDSDFEHPVIVTIQVERESRINFIAFSPGYEPSDDMLFLTNRNNARRNLPTAVVRNGAISMEYSYYISEEVSHEYLKESVVSKTLHSMWSAYVDLERDNVG